MKNIVEQEIDFKRNRYRILLILTGLMFVVMLFFTIIYFVDYNKKYGYFEKIVATVVEYETVEGKECAVIEYKIKNQEYQKTTNFDDLEIGDEITIFYDTNNPVGVIYSRDARYYALPIITIIFGLVDIGLVVLYILHYREVDKKKKK